MKLHFSCKCSFHANEYIQVLAPPVGKEHKDSMLLDGRRAAFSMEKSSSDIITLSKDDDMASLFEGTLKSYYTHPKMYTNM